MSRKQLQNLTEPMYYILLCLMEPLHGYGIMQKIKEITGNRVIVGPGTLYNLIARFEKEGIIEQTSNTSNKKIYQITTKGQEILKEEWRRLNQQVIDGQNILNKGDNNEK